MKKVLVTGAKGFIGRHCLPFLENEQFDIHAVSSTVDSANRAASSGVRWHRTDLLDEQQVQRLIEEVRPNYLLHLAWYTRHKQYWTASENLDWVRASLHLARRFAESGGERSVIAGSCAEYDWQFGQCVENTTPLKPESLYGVCKQALNLTTSAFFAQHGVSSAWGRIFYVYGAHEYKDRFVPSMVRSILRGETAHCSSGDQIRDFLHVEDVAAAFVSLLTSDVQGNVNIASGTPRYIKDLALTIATQIGRPDLLSFDTSNHQSADAPVVVASVERLRNELNFVPSRSLDEGLKQTIDWWRQNDKVTAKT